MVRHEVCKLQFVRGYEAGKLPVVFVHGLFGGPGNWSTMIDRLSRDPAISARFQFLTFRYDSLRPIPESGLRLAEALHEARRQLDPRGSDRSFERVVLVGHSLGGLVAKATSRAFDRERLELARARSRDDWPTRAPRAGRFIFIATPHRGAPLDRGAIRAVGSWLARSLRRSAAGAGARPSSIDQLAWEHPLLDKLEQSRVTEGTPFHSIIAALGDPSIEGATDGIVPVASARLGGARSELVVRAHHLCLGQPEVIGTVRKILIEDVAAPLGPASAAGRIASASMEIPAPAAGQPETHADASALGVRNPLAVTSASAVYLGRRRRRKEVVTYDVSPINGEDPGTGGASTENGAECPPVSHPLTKHRMSMFDNNGEIA